MFHLSQICVSSVTTSTLEGRPRADPSSRLCMMQWTVLLRGWVWPNTDRPYLGTTRWTYGCLSCRLLLACVTCQTSWLDFCNSFKTQAETLPWQAVYFFRLLLSPGVVKGSAPGIRLEEACRQTWEQCHRKRMRVPALNVMVATKAARTSN